MIRIRIRIRMIRMIGASTTSKDSPVVIFCSRATVMCHHNQSHHDDFENDDDDVDDNNGNSKTPVAGFTSSRGLWRRFHPEEWSNGPTPLQQV